MNNDRDGKKAAVDLDNLHLLLDGAHSRPPQPKPEPTTKTSAPPHPSSPPLQQSQTSRVLDYLNQIDTLRGHLKEKVFGQDAAIDAICDTLDKQAYQTRQRGPAGIFLFVGPSGTGKTYLANMLAAEMGGDWKSHTIDMAALTNENQSSRIDGDEPTFLNARSGELTNFVREHPRSVIVFDDIDRAHPGIVARLASMLDSGYLKDKYGFWKISDKVREMLATPEVDFRECILIFTTRAGEGAYDDPSFAALMQKSPAQAATMLVQELAQVKAGAGYDAHAKQFSAAMLNHWATGGAILFRRLGLNDLAQIAEQATLAAMRKLFDELGFEGRIDYRNVELFQALVLALAPQVDARRVQREAAQRVLDAIVERVRRMSQPTAGVQHVHIGQRTAISTVLALFAGREPLNECFRKNLTLDYRVITEIRDNVLYVDLLGCKLRQIAHAQDVRGQGAIRVELPAVSFDAIAGHDYIKGRLKEVVNLLRAPARLKDLGVGIPKGMLLYGPPGTGKTLLAKALAHEAELPFIATTGSEILNLDLLKLVFQRARKYAPSILFIDEVDAVGRRDRGGYDVVINQILSELDGFDTSLAPPVFVVAATNLKDKIDPAIIRSGRIDLHLEVPPLDAGARAYFIERYLELPNDGSLDRKELITLTAGMSGADLEKVRREVALEMVRLGRDTIDATMLAEHINTLKYGVATPRSPRLAHFLEHTAYHEAGHAVVSMILNPDVRIEQVTVAPRGDSLGFVSYENDSLAGRRMTRKEFMDLMCVALAGRLAQEKKFPGEGLDSGGSDDIARASHLAYVAIATAGLDEEYGPLSVQWIDPHGNGRGAAADPIQSAAGAQALRRMQAWLDEAQQICRTLIDERWDKVESVAAWLQSEETMDGAMLRKLVRGA